MQNQMFACYDPLDCTDDLQAALDDASASEVRVPAGGAPWQTRPRFLRRSNVAITLERGVAVRGLAAAVAHPAAAAHPRCRRRRDSTARRRRPAVAHPKTAATARARGRA